MTETFTSRGGVKGNIYFILDFFPFYWKAPSVYIFELPQEATDKGEEDEHWMDNCVEEVFLLLSLRTHIDLAQI